MINKDICENCKKALTGNEIAMHRKLIGRYAESFMCTECIAKYFEVSSDLIREKMEYFIKTGCTLFPDNQ